MSFKDTFNRITAAGMGGLGILGSIGMTVSWLQAGFEPPFLLAYAIFGGMGYLGTKNYLAIDKKTKLRLEQKTEQEVLRMAALSGGKLTITEVAIRMNISVDEAKITLEGLSKKGAMEIEITAAGGLVYALSNFLTAEEKNQTFRLS